LENAAPGKLELNKSPRY